MLPRPRLVCQEPGLRPIGRSPGVPDKSSRGLGSMSRYSAQILICFIAYIFHLFYSSVSLVGNFAGLPVCTVPSAIVIRMRLAIRQSKLPAYPAEVQLAQENSLAFMPQDWWNWQIKWMKSVSIGSFQYKNQVKGEFFAYMWVILLYFSTESGLISGILEVWLFWNFNQVRNLTAVRQLSNLSLKVFFRQLGMKMLKYENQKLILGQIFTFCAPNVVNFSVWFIQLTAWIFLNTWLLVMWLNRVRC